MAAKVCKFNEPTEVPFGCLSPMSPHAIIIRHVKYPSVHHFFLSERFKGSSAEAAIQSAPSLWECDRYVKQAEAAGLQRDDWESVKVDIMLLGCYYKFKQNSDAMTMLSQTGGKTIVYHTAEDAFWGDDATGEGKNMLGVILMAVRKRIAAEDKKRPHPPRRKQQQR